jgi:hypothetical protein
VFNSPATVEYVGGKIRLTATEAGLVQMWLQPYHPQLHNIRAGNVYTVYCGSAVVAAGNPGTPSMTLLFYQNGSGVGGDVQTLLPGQGTGQAPATADQAGIFVRFSASAAGDAIDFDEFGLWDGVGGGWVPSGEAVQGQGQVVLHPFTDDVSVQVWDHGRGRLQRVWYDTGWRDIKTLVDTTSFTATGTGLFLLIRRIGFQVNLAFRVAVASSTDPRHTFLPLMIAPGGFAPLQQGLMGPCVIGTGINGADAVAKNAAASTGSVSNFQTLTRIEVSAPGVTAPYAPGDVVSGVVIYQTGKTMPSSLPGVMQYPAPE